MAIDSQGRNANPLDEFQSYSCHHILMVAANTEDFLSIQDANRNGNFDTSTFENVSLTEPIPGSNKKSGGVYVVTDTRKNSNFQIKDISYESMLSGPTQLSAPIITSDLKMQIHDFYGITFLNYLQYIVDIALKTDYTGLVWVLKTLFIGHTESGTTEVVSISEIPLMLSRVDTEFREDGGHYALSFVQYTMGAPSRSPQACYVGQSSTHLKSDSNRTLASVVQDFQNHLNKELKDYYDKLRVVQQPASGSEKSQQLNNEKAHVGRLVQYMFTMPDEWKNWTVDGSAEARKETNWKEHTTKADKNTQVGSKSKTSGTPATGAVTIDLRPDMTVEAGLEEIFKHCDQLLARASQSKQKKGEEIKFWKIISSMTSDTETVCLHWDIYDHTATDVSVDTDGKPKQKQNFDTDITTNGVKRPFNSLEFDYIFSGKNNDIIKFEMKLSGANVLLSTSVNHDAQSKVTQNQKNNKQGSDTQTKTNVTFIKQNTPIFMPEKTSDQLQGFSYIAPGSTQDASIRQEYVKNLTAWYATSQMNASVTIRGNPNLLNITAVPLAPHVPGVLANDSKNSATSSSAQTAYKNHVDRLRKNERVKDQPLSKELFSSPLFVKINVYGPNLKDQNFDGQPYNDDFAKKFWYNDYYRVFRIGNHFSSDGTFTQDLLMTVNNLYEKPATADADNKDGKK